MKKISQVLLSIAFACQMAGSSTAGEIRKVMVGGEVEFDACGATGEVHRLNPNGDNFLAVRAGPGSNNKMLDKLRTGNQVFLCDQAGSWIGVVYGSDGQNCGVGSPIAKKQPYSGSCSSGWVHERYIRLIAG